MVEVELTTLGGYDLKTEGAEPRFINYHAGTAPEINLQKGPLIEKSHRDPVFVLLKYLGEDVIKTTSSEILGKLEKEINEVR